VLVELLLQLEAEFVDVPVPAPEERVADGGRLRREGA
jgi:hypothetical protein